MDSNTSSPVKTDKERAIEIVECSRRTHLEWYNHLGQCTECLNDPKVIEHVGDKEHHASLVADYDLVLKVLRGEE